MAKYSASNKPLTAAALRNKIATDTGLTRKQVTAILDALVSEIEKNFGNTASVGLATLGLVRTDGEVSACLKWPESIKLTFRSNLLPGPDDCCVHGLHKYFKSRRANDREQPVCGRCGNDTINWKRLHARKIKYVAYTVAQLNTDRWRHEWWVKDIDPKAVQHTLKKGLAGIEHAVRKRVEASVGPEQPFRDGVKLPSEENIIFYGQHATATCCRKCIKVWHGIPRGRKLTQEEIDYLAELVCVYIRKRFPDGERSPGNIAV